MFNTEWVRYALGLPSNRGSSSVWRVLVVEDDPLMRAYFSSSVQQCPELELAASFGTVREALAWLDDDVNTLDVLLTDLGLPDGNGLQVIHRAVRRHPRCEPLVISMFGDDANVLASIEAGALGYIHKDSTPQDIAQTILAMRAGESPISPMIARRVLAKYRADSADRGPETPAGQRTLDASAQSSAHTGLLSAREQEVLSLIARGFSYAEIARLKGLSVHTIQTHIKNLYAKLSVNSKSEAVFEATRMGLLPPQG